MDPQTITATTGFIGAVVALLTAIGGGIGVLIRRADRKRESGETLMMDNLKAQIRDAKARIRWLEEVTQIQRRDGTAWREQLLRHDIDPEPPEWTEWPPAPQEET